MVVTEANERRDELMRALVVCLHSPGRMRLLLDGRTPSDLFWLGIEHYAIWMVVEDRLCSEVLGLDEVASNDTGNFHWNAQLALTEILSH